MSEQTEPRVEATPAAAGGGLPSRFGRNLAVSYWVPLVRGLALLVVTPIVLHRLGDAQFGIWSLIGSAVAYLELLDFGFGVATIKLVAEDAGRRPEAVVRTINTLFFVLLGLGVAILAVGLVLAAYAPSIFTVPADLEHETVMAFALLVIALSVSIPGDTFGGALGGHSRFDLLGYSNILQAGVTAVVTIAVVLAGGGLVALAASSAGVGTCMHVVRFLFLRRILPELRLSPRLVARDHVRRSAGLSSWLMLRNVAGVINTRVDLIVIGIALRPRDVALYAVGLKLAQVLQRGIRPLSSLMMPEASALEREGDWDRLRALLSSGTRATMTVAVPLTICLAVLAGPAVDAWVGDGYGSSARVLVILALALGGRAISVTAEAVIIGTGKGRLAALIQGAEAVVNLGLSIVLVHRMGLVGVALGSLAGALVNLPAFLPTACRVTRQSLAGFAREALLPHLVPAAVVTAALLLARPVVDGVVPVLLAAAGAGLAYLVLYYRVGATPGERDKIRRVIARVL